MAFKRRILSLMAAILWIHCCHSMDPLFRDRMILYHVPGFWTWKLSGWWLTYPSEKYEWVTVGMMTFPIHGKIISCSKPPTSYNIHMDMKAIWYPDTWYPNTWYADIWYPNKYLTSLKQCHLDPFGADSLYSPWFRLWRRSYVVNERHVNYNSPNVWYCIKLLKVLIRYKFNV